ncbi:MAG: hypothetical protein AUK55_15505 [Syntrophobacteraceae bacterium CG2_30_61_12]|nr:MAG: hypothetical protein AUK55_15505 [Syntrophobacteraceae bacterium CG2_30_61_12]
MSATSASAADNPGGSQWSRLAPAADRHRSCFGPRVSALQEELLTAAELEVRATLAFLDRDPRLAAINRPAREALQRLLMERLPGGLDLCHLAAPLDLTPPPAYPVVLAAAAALAIDPEDGDMLWLPRERAAVGSGGAKTAEPAAAVGPANHSWNARERSALTVMLATAVINEQLLRCRRLCIETTATGCTRAAVRVALDQLAAALANPAVHGPRTQAPARNSALERRLLLARTLFGDLSVGARAPLLQLARELALILWEPRETRQRAIAAWTLTAPLGEAVQDAAAALILDTWAATVDPESGRRREGPNP